MKDMKKKAISAILTAAVLVSVFPVNVFAGDSHDIVGNYQVYAYCSTKSSSHQISVLSGSGATYPTGSAKAYYTLNGATKTASPAGSSYKTYWAASYSCPGNIYKATTTGYGKTVTAVP